jgi:hypothetical protein
MVLINPSGKLNELIEFFVRDSDCSAGRADKWGIELETSLRPGRFCPLYRSLDAREYEFPRGAALARSGFMQATVQVAGQGNRGTDRFWLHASPY